MSTEEKDIERSKSAPIDHDAGDVGIVKDVKNADAALDFLRSEGHVREMTKEDEKKLLRKIDWMVMPLMWCCKHVIREHVPFRLLADHANDRLLSSIP